MFAKIALLVLPALAVASTESPLEPRGKTINGYDFKGCYFDCYDGMNRYLPHFAYADDNNSVTKCTAACSAAGYSAAGLQFGKECWCGNQVAGQKAKNSDCWVKCKNGGNCGGPCRNSIWSK